MSKGDTFENDFLKLIFNATAIADLADNDATSPKTVLWVALHTSSPGEAGSQTTNEVATGNYGGYLRKSVGRTATGFTVSTNSVSPVDPITYAQCTSGTATITHASVGTASSGAGKMLYYGTVTPNISVSTGVTPILASGSAITED